MKKFFLYLFCYFSTSAFAQNNVLCNSLDTNHPECLKIAKTMYGVRAAHIANALIKTKKAKEGKTLELTKALSIVKRLQSENEFMAAFKLCGQISKTYTQGETCLDNTYMVDARKKQHQSDNSTTFKQTNTTSETQFKTKLLNPEVKEYISTTYKPTANKKLVIYPNATPNCPYGQAFMQALKKQQNRKDLEKAYLFRPMITQISESSFSNIEEAEYAGQKVMNFLNACGIFCIVNLENNWIYSFGNAVGLEEANALPKLFNSLKSK